jgi:SAM-dependent methyltransferase
VKPIDFDLVADLYDSYVRTDADHAFWLARASSCPAPALELMCGTGRIALALGRAGIEVEGLDYSAGLLARFREKLAAEHLAATLYESDARAFSTGRRYGLVFIGFNSIAEVLDDNDKRRVFACVRGHLRPDGQFWLTLHNPPVRRATLDGRSHVLCVAQPLPDGSLLDMSACFSLDAATNVVTGEQRFVVSREGCEVRSIVQPVRFHLQPPEDLCAQLEASGFRIDQRFGTYDATPFEATTSPYCILGCRVA